jgi:hypothetical protein
MGEYNGGMITVFVFTNGEPQAKAKKSVVRVREKESEKEAVVRGYPLVSFYYPLSREPWHTPMRYVRVISSNLTHIIGLEVMVGEGGKQKYAYKKFLISKASNMALLEFNPSKMV